LAPSSWAALLLILGWQGARRQVSLASTIFEPLGDEWDVAIGAAFGALSRCQRGNKSGGCARYWRTETQDKGANDMHFLLALPRDTSWRCTVAQNPAHAPSLEWLIS
jgi:hypothetical protein